MDESIKSGDPGTDWKAVQVLLNRSVNTSAPSLFPLHTRRLVRNRQTLFVRIVFFYCKNEYTQQVQFQFIAGNHSTW